MRYVVTVTVTGPNGQTARRVFAWLVDAIDYARLSAGIGNRCEIAKEVPDGVQV
ncbi:MAG: hypothetical protein WCS59_06635 [Sphaerochaetaceae bacterium]